MVECYTVAQASQSLLGITIKTDRKTNQRSKNIPWEPQVLVGTGLLAAHSTVEAEQGEPWQDQLEGRPGSREDRRG